jgi:hypothetical protein
MQRFPAHYFKGKQADLRNDFEEIGRGFLNLVTGGGGGELPKAIGDAVALGTAGILALSVIIFVCGYVATRPFVSSFRLKRQILGLAGQHDLGVRDTASSWYVNKSVGAYEEERRFFAALDRQPPMEQSVDLMTLLFPPLCIMVIAALVGWAAGPWAPLPLRQLSYPFYGRWALLALMLWTAILGILRLLWLRDCQRGRAGQRCPPPLVGYVPGSGGGYVESRPLTEAVAWPLAIGLLAGVFYPPFGAISFYRFALTADRFRVTTGERRPRSRGGHPLITAVAFASIVLTPIVLVVHLWRLTSLLEKVNERVYRTLAILACSALLVIVGPGVVLYRVTVGDWKELTGLVFFAMLPTVVYAALIAAIQHCQNYLLETRAERVPYGKCESKWKRAPEASPVPTNGLPRQRVVPPGLQGDRDPQDTS